MIYMKVRKYKATDQKVWDDFVIKSKNSHFMFFRDYLDYHSNRFEDFSLIVSNDDHTVIGILPANINHQALVSHEGLTFGAVSYTHLTLPTKA